MGNRKWVSLVLAAALLVFGAGVAVGEVASDLSPMPKASGLWGFFDGNKLYSWDRTAQIFYVAGAMDAFRTVVNEMDSGVVQAGSAALLAWVISKQAAGTNPPAIDWSDPVLSPYRTAMEKEAGQVIGKLAYLKVKTSVLGVTLGQFTDLVVAYLRNHPEERQNSAALLVWRALAQAEWK